MDTAAFYITTSDITIPLIKVCIYKHSLVLLVVTCLSSLAARDVIFSVLGFFITDNPDISETTLLLHQMLSAVITEDCKSAAKMRFCEGEAALGWSRLPTGRQRRSCEPGIIAGLTVSAAGCCFNCSSISAATGQKLSWMQCLFFHLLFYRK